MEVVFLIIVASVVLCSPFFLFLDLDKIRETRALKRCYAIYEKISKEKTNQSAFRSTFKNLQYLKKILKNKRCTKRLVQHIIAVREWAWTPPVFPDESLRGADSLWRLTENRQLFNKKELKAIDQGNAEIEKELSPYKSLPTRAEIIEARNNAVKEGAITADGPRSSE